MIFLHSISHKIRFANPLTSIANSEKSISYMHSYFYNVKKKGLIAVALVLEATSASSTGNFETKARSLGMRPTGLLPSFSTSEKFISSISLVEYAKFYLHILLRNDLLRKYPLLQYLLNSFFPIVFHYYMQLQFVVAHEYTIQNQLNT